MFNKKSHFLCFLTISFMNLCDELSAGAKHGYSNYYANHDFDLLIFTQRWPITGCMEWMDEGHNHECLLPSQKDIWTIHGVWPTRFGTLGPSFCNKSATFDVNTLKPIMDQLEQNWINIEKGTPEASFWRHEWLKHGTCAALIEELDTENKYFGQGLTWLQQYEMTGILARANITSGAKYNVTDFHDAIKSALNRNPSTHCVRNKHTGDTYLDEIRICFNKRLELVDCDGVVLGRTDLSYWENGVITNCRHDEPIAYPNVLPKHLINRKLADKDKTVWTFPWVNLYKLIQILKWFTF